jgi:hypothetical protein
MLPSNADPRWRALLVAPLAFEPRSFALKLLLTRLRRDVERDASGKKVDGAVEELRGFLERHAEISREDMRSIFDSN